MADIVIYVSGYCGYCYRARGLLDGLDVEYKAIEISEEAELRTEMEQRSGRTSVPQIFINDQHIGGYDDLAALNAAGDLALLLAK